MPKVTAETRLSIGSWVTWSRPDGPDATGYVLRHGHDAHGVYTEISIGGERVRVHRSQLRSNVLLNARNKEGT